MVRVSRFRSLWGIEPGENFSNWARVFPLLKAHGYRGVEISIDGLEVPRGDEDYLHIKSLAEQNSLQITALIHSYTVHVEGTAEDHLAFYRRRLGAARLLGVVKVNAQSGFDAWPLDESVRFYRATFAVDAEMGLAGRVSHETHRSRSLFNPWVTDAILKQVPDLLITADISHWVVVTERCLTQPQDRAILARVARRVGHVHARMGTTQSSQCPEPLNPIFAEERAFFEAAWLQMAAAVAERDGPGAELTLVPEYGEFPYHPINSARTFGQLADDEGLRIQELLEKGL